MSDQKRIALVTYDRAGERMSRECDPSEAFIVARAMVLDDHPRAPIEGILVYDAEDGECTYADDGDHDFVGAAEAGLKSGLADRDANCSGAGA